MLVTFTSTLLLLSAVAGSVGDNLVFDFCFLNPRIDGAAVEASDIADLARWAQMTAEHRFLSPSSTRHAIMRIE